MNNKTAIDSDSSIDSSQASVDDSDRRKLFIIGISLGAGIMSNYLAQSKSKCKVDAAFGLACHFSIEKSFEWLKNSLYGLYDVALGLSCRTTCKALYNDFDRMIEKIDPNRVTKEDLAKVYNISKDYSTLVAKAAGFKDV